MIRASIQANSVEQYVLERGGVLTISIQFIMQG